ncbi:MAG TPA: ABC transporter permease [Acidimicrobiales bacterium]
MITETITPVPLTEGRRPLLANPRLRWLVYGIGTFLVLVLVEELARPQTDDIMSSGTAGSTLRFAVPILLAGLGGIWAERSGVINIGLEGMMILGTWFGAWGAWEFGPWWGVLLGLLAGAGGGLLHAIATVTFGVDHIVSGVAINILAPGLTRYLSVETYTAGTGGGATQSPSVSSVSHFSLPVLSGGDLFGWHSPNFFGWLEERDWFFLSELGGVLHGLTSGVSWLTALTGVLVIGSVIVLWRTRFGLRVRSVGEYPEAAETLGVNVYRMKYIAVVVSGALAGLGGAFLAIEAAGIYRQGQTQGRGYIGLATVIFGNWRPIGAALGSLLFGFTDALQLRDERAVHALLLFAAILITFALARSLYLRTFRTAVLLAPLAALFAIWYAASETVPNELPQVTPHVTTLLVLMFATTRLRPPAADGARYRRGQAA